MKTFRTLYKFIPNILKTIGNKIKMKRLSIQLYRAFSTTVNKTTNVAKPIDPLKNVTGLSSKVVTNNDAKAVNGTGKDYKVPEYFGFNRMSYSEAEVEMEKFRIPQPIAPRK